MDSTATSHTMVALSPGWSPPWSIALVLSRPLGPPCVFLPSGPNQLLPVPRKYSQAGSDPTGWGLETLGRPHPAYYPLQGQKWWMEADEPWQALACCMEIAQVVHSPDPTTYISHFPVHQVSWGTLLWAMPGPRALG